MDSRERVFTAMAHQKPDRVPLDIVARQEVWEELKACFQEEDEVTLRKILGVDMFRMGFPLKDPDFQRKADYRLSGASPSAGGTYILHSDGTFEDVWGVLRKQDQDKKYDEWVSGPLRDVNDLDAYRFPSFDVTADDDFFKKTIAVRKQDFVTYGEIDNPFKRAWLLRGMENFLMDMYLNPDFAEALLKKIFAFAEEMAVRYAQAGMDIIWINGDIAMQKRMLMSPEVWRRFFKRPFGEMIHRVKQKFHLPFFFHSDGNLEEVFADLIDVGFDMINPIQPESMDPFAIKKRFGKFVTLHGLVSVQTLLPNSTTVKIQKTVIQYVNELGYDGGLVLAPTNYIMYDTPLENILVFYKTVRESFF